jgi:transposase
MMAIPLLPFVLPGFVVVRVDVHETQLRVEAMSLARDAHCPACQHISRRIHSQYFRSAGDLPRSEYLVRLWLSVRRFRCENRTCPQRTFVERFPTIIPFRARRTVRLTRTLHTIATTLSANVGARLATKLRIRVSHDTLTRVLRTCPLPHVPTPRILGVDDFAFKKGHRYGTILVDLERHQPIDLLPDRTAGTLATWLQAHPGVQVIARDRSGEYARGATLGAPAAQQVADRWHLLQNLRDALERMCNRLYRTLQQLPPLLLPSAVATTNALLPMIQALRLPSTHEQALRAHARDRRFVRYTQVRALITAGVSQFQIAKQLQMSRAAVRRFALASLFPERRPRARQARMLDGFEDYLEERWRSGCTNASQLWRELLARGYPGVRKQVARWAQQHRARADQTTPANQSGTSSARTILADDTHAPPQHTHTPLPSPRQLAWLLLRTAARDTDEIPAFLAHILQHSPVLLAHTLAQQFQRILQTKTPELLDTWLAACDGSTSTELQSLATSFRADKAAVRAACAEPWSTGQVEGQNTRLKLLKREMYGRATFALLRQRVLANAC